MENNKDNKIKLNLKKKKSGEKEPRREKNFFFFFLRLCLVSVKYFLENTYFLEMLFSGKENIFKCLVVFGKIL